ncbi:MAG: diaminopimelate epimerase [Deltaproteobacteria bacterium HGW-Deltaproteobacteria-7]|nr:MAG: diaminopimelate epimerase [Deltaproteobacteria bacterium HGW-Deltaproteobacteria-7]PKN18738.1 MAG: diaminopimelate epimerase [Deltaproteobacteria bacterium HGW-Deltaproteobacteria-6]
MNKTRFISFWKMSGSGNDFIIIDNRDLSLDVGDLPVFARRICARKVSVGADGLFLIEPSASVDFKWRFFNSDGSMGEMCGNGARCVARWAYQNGVTGAKLSFETLAGIIDAEVSDDTVKVRLTDPSLLQQNVSLFLQGGPCGLDHIDTGVPHAVCFVESVEASDVVATGRQIRRHDYFQPKGTNANFAEVSDPHQMKVRTYERGVEDETLACGTGVVASVLAAAGRSLVESPVDVTVQSGEILRVYFSRRDGRFEEIYLEGKVKIVYQGMLFEEAYK